ncbi:unnamed protein product [Coffea canephora]|uniref:Subtilisin inhibitor 1 n=1 Tax=Coffea canephora TaxID=49390 RepID=A0A068V1H0_COFCA|nr:subtilisin inhibitor CLSI-I-like [Coffea arabica]CDP14354.1 unnamed protein product [Coffea canephora]
MAEEDSKQNAISNDQPQQPLPTLPGYRYGGGGSGERKTWPELVGLTSEEAERRIKEEIPGVNVHVIPPDYFVTMDFRTDRVRIFTDSSGKVSRAPMIG